MNIRWNRLDARAWAAALPGNATALQQSWRYGAAVQALGRAVQRAEIWQDGLFLGLAQILTRRFGPLTAAVLPRGPILLDGPGRTAEIARALRRGLPEPGLRLLLTVPDHPAPGLLPLLTPQILAEVPLSGTESQLRARLHGKWRNRLARAERARLKVAITRPTAGDLAWLTERDRAQGAARGYRGLPPAFLAAWGAQDGPPMQLFTARAGGDIIAAMLFLDHPPGATYHIGWTGAAGRAQSAHHLLMWKAIRHFAAQGHLRLDLGPLDTVGAPGLARFKLGTGAVARPLGAASLVPPLALPRPFAPLLRPSRN